ncbi:50S ribosomal protein L23 [Desulfohalobiaceae bacterium Ax17]|jgi:large subunit ribosomal protein L23|uniref:50S ribosomal protein L23 n=1 Tax=Desulfovulcanus ferrireducens TaxID=2831190 RepID=UPI00207BBE08|nr:50S ribosomal protein L23 [Desulfovulcanus ferrireducens]MBT8762884.1 50S ribosomal protein L23 [Desulfovulcanus ferrireducens]
MDSTQILIKPLISEKATLLKDAYNKVVFIVHPDANKYQIKKAVESLFNVKVEKVSIVRQKPVLRKRFGRVVGKKSGYKKAYVSLSAGDKIEFFEGV